jgi:hypothetical protein
VAVTVKFVKVTNKCDRPITVHTRFPRPKKSGSSKDPKPVESQIKLAPGQTSARAIALTALIGARNWDTLNARGCIGLEFVPWTPAFATVTARAEPSTFDVQVPGAKPRRVKLSPGQKSRTVPLLAIPQRHRLESLAKRKRITLDRSYIGPSYTSGAAGSLGSDDVYICNECGGPIVFRYHPPVPIHI